METETLQTMESEVLSIIHLLWTVAPERFDVAAGRWTDNTSEARVEQLLRYLPSNPAVIAAGFEARGITGFPCYAARCPVANYVRAVTGLDISISQTSFMVDDGNRRADTTVPPQVTEFITRFDRNEYPNLIAYPEKG